jgi:PKHD-type hydroxylase
VTAIPNQRPFRPLTEHVTRHSNDTISLVATVPRFLSPQECAAVIAKAQRSQRFQGTVGEAGEEAAPIRRSEIHFFYPDQESDWLFARFDAVITRLNQEYRFDLQGFYEGVQVASYEGGGHYDWHMDLGTEFASVRKLSLSVQLSAPSDYDDGELEFLHTGDCASREQGTLIAFPSYLVHRVRPVSRGRRWSLVSWIAGPPFR